MENNNNDILKRFSYDTYTIDALKQLFNKHIMNSKSTDDVSMKAGRFIALEIINNVWSELEKFRIKEDETKEKKQIGL
jgi:hypothetical protein